MDDDDQHNFSKPLAQEYIEQADDTLQQIDKYHVRLFNPQSL